MKDQRKPVWVVKALEGEVVGVCSRSYVAEGMVNKAADREPQVVLTYMDRHFDYFRTPVELSVFDPDNFASDDQSIVWIVEDVSRVGVTVCSTQKNGQRVYDILDADGERPMMFSMRLNVLTAYVDEPRSFSGGGSIRSVFRDGAWIDMRGWFETQSDNTHKWMEEPC